jgi:hypothetical protein
MDAKYFLYRMPLSVPKGTRSFYYSESPYTLTSAEFIPKFFSSVTLWSLVPCVFPDIVAPYVSERSPNSTLSPYGNPLPSL